LTGTAGSVEALQAGAPCPLCESPLQAKRLPEAGGDEAPLRLVLRGLPILACEAPHRYFVAQQFPIWLLNALLEEELARVPAGTAKGLLFRKYACGGCGAVLPAAASGPRTFPAHLAYGDGPEFSVDLTMPAFRCGACGCEQARSGAELAKLLPSALVHAFKGAGIKAPG